MTTASASQAHWNTTESEAITRAIASDGAAFEYLYDSHRKHVYSVCLRMLKSPADAEDFTQQAFLQAFRKISSFRGESRFSTWLHRVTINLVLMHLRRRVRTEIRTEDFEIVIESDAREIGAEDASLLGAIDRLNLRRAVLKLPPGQRRLFLLHDVIGYKHCEIARILQCSIGCSKSQLHKARKRLRDLLSEQPWRANAEAVSG